MTKECPARLVRNWLNQASWLGSLVCPECSRCQPVCGLCCLSQGHWPGWAWRREWDQLTPERGPFSRTWGAGGQGGGPRSREGGPLTKFSPFMPLASIPANKSYTPPIRYIILTLWLVEGAKCLSAEWVLAVTPVLKLPAYLRFYFQMWLTAGWLWHSRRKHTACYYACINILINTRYRSGKVITCHHFSASSKKSLLCNCSVIYLGRMCYIPQRLFLFNSLHLLFKIHNIPSQGLPWSKINLAI